MSHIYIPISKGLLDDPKHENSMGNAVWLYMRLIDMVTIVDENNIGWILGKKPIKLEDLLFDKSFPTRQRQLALLKSEGYCVVKKTHYGSVIGVTKIKKRLNKAFHRLIKTDNSKTPRVIKNETKLIKIDNSNKTNTGLIQSSTSVDDTLRRFKKRDYDEILQAYQRLKPIILKGKQFGYPMKYIREMDESDVKKKEIIGLMEFFSDAPDSSWASSWTMATVAKKMPEYLAGKLKI